MYDDQKDEDAYTIKNGNAKAGGKKKKGGVTDWTSWDNHTGEWSHILDEAGTGIKPELRPILEIENFDNFCEFSAKCKLCRNAKNKPKFVSAH